MNDPFTSTFRFADAVQRGRELGPLDPLVRLACRISPQFRREVLRAEAAEVAQRLEGLPKAEVEHLAAERAGRSSRTIRRWWATEAERDD